MMGRAYSFKKNLMLEKIEDRRGLDSITDSMNMGLSTLQETVKDREAWHVAVHRVTMSRK